MIKSRNGSSARESAEPMSKSKSLSLPVQSTPKNPNAAPAIKEPQKTTVSRERDAPAGRHRGRAIARDERRCADALNRLDSDERTLVSIEGVSNGSPSREAEPMRGRTSTRRRASRYWERGRQAPRHLAARFLPSYKFFRPLSYSLARHYALKLNLTVIVSTRRKSV